MGGAFSSLSQSLAVNLQNTEQSKCTVPSTCQTAAVGSFVNDGTLDCEKITVAANNNSSQFTCSINQTAMASANVAQTAANMANATETASVQRYGFPLAMIPPDWVLVHQRPAGTPSVVKP